MKRKTIICLLAGLLLLFPGCEKKEPSGPGTDPVDQPDWIIGADLSLVTKLQFAGAVYTDFQGNNVDVLPFFREKGLIISEYACSWILIFNQLPARTWIM